MSTSGCVVYGRALAWLGCAALTAASAAGEFDRAGGFSSEQVLIRTRPGVRPVAVDGRQMLTPLSGVTPVTKTPAVTSLAKTLERFAVSVITPVFEGPFAHPNRAAKLGLDRVYKIRIPRGTDTPALVTALNEYPKLIEYAELDGVGGVAELIPDDRGFPNQYGLLNTGQTILNQVGVAGADINVTQVWDFERGDPEMVLAILDAGVDPHDDLLLRLVPGRNVAADPNNDNTADLCFSHGTHVAGISAASSNNLQGIAGVDWRCRVMPVQVFLDDDDPCDGLESWLAEGIVWATDNGADVINMSLQYSGGTSVLHDAVLYAYGEGVTMVSAAGNSGANLLAFPARWPETIAVGALTNAGVRWFLLPGNGSNAGPELDLMAPGGTVWSLDGTSGYKFLSGTSMASPHVAGAVALLKSINPGIGPDVAQSILRDTAVDVDPPGFDNETGQGRLNVLAAVNRAATDIDADGTIGINDLLALLAAWGACGDCLGCPGDIDHDCVVGITDLLVLLGAWEV